MKEDNVKLGRAMLEREAKKKGYDFSELLTAESFKLVSPRFSFTSPEEMYASIGLGAVATNQVLFKFIDIYKREQPRLLDSLAPSDTRKHKNSAEGVYVKGVSGLLIRFAGCCNPVPGDKIIGFVSKGRGVTVHRHNCPNMQNEDKNRFIKVEWTGRGGSGFFVSLKVTFDEKGNIEYFYCVLTETYIINGEVANAITCKATWTFSDYGTTVVEVPEE
jgi:GTP pyrophosphokinase